MANTIMTHGVSSTRIAEILRSARNLMNNGGRHWIKGEEKVNLNNVLVDPKTHRFNYFQDDEVLDGKDEYAFCSIGAIYEVVGQNTREANAAAFELARSINPLFLENIKDSWKDNWFDNHWYDDSANCTRKEYWESCNCEAPNPSPLDLVDYLEDYEYETVIETITNANDKDETTWKDVSNWFTRAATRASKRRG